MDNLIANIRINDPEFDFTTHTMTETISAKALEIREKAIVDACIQAAKEAGITELILIDRQFVTDAIIEKVYREFGELKEDAHGETYSKPD